MTTLSSTRMASRNTREVRERADQLIAEGNNIYCHGEVNNREDYCRDGISKQKRGARILKALEAIGG